MNERIEAIQSAIRTFEKFNLTKQDTLDILIILIATWVKINCDDEETTKDVIDSVIKGINTIVYSPETRLN